MLTPTNIQICFLYFHLKDLCTLQRYILCYIRCIKFEKKKKVNAAVRVFLILSEWQINWRLSLFWLPLSISIYPLFLKVVKTPLWRFFLLF